MLAGIVWGIAGEDPKGSWETFVISCSWKFSLSAIYLLKIEIEGYSNIFQTN